jgi:hypothetical protein
MSDITGIIIISLVALILAGIAFVDSLIARAKRKPEVDKDYLELEDGDLVIVDSGKVTIRRLGASAVAQEINTGIGDEGNSTITFKSGRGTQKVKIS